jgi:iron complex transport system substrate-binding protein
MRPRKSATCGNGAVIATRRIAPGVLRAPHPRRPARNAGMTQRRSRLYKPPSMPPPERIICLTEETVETLYLLGEDARIVGVSGFVVRPPEARREKPRVSTFTDADIEKILALEPDLVFTFSDIQADIAADLIRRGLHVHAFNHRSVAGILDMIEMVGAMVGAADKADRLVAEMNERLARARARKAGFAKTPKVFFEEWDDPLISAIGWVSELVEIAGGENVFSHLAEMQGAKDRIVAHADVIAAAPDIIMGSWCGKKFKPKTVAAREGFADIPAVKNGRLYEVKSPIILQPGPAALTDGLDALQDIIAAYQNA